MTDYCTLDDVRVEHKAVGSADDAVVRRHIRQISSRIDSIMAPRAKRPFFAPYIERRDFMLKTRFVDSWNNTFMFKQPLLSVTTVLLDTTDVTTNVENFPLTARPIRGLRLTTRTRSWYNAANLSTNFPYVKITGSWGFSSDIDNAWLEYDTLNADITAAATSLVVADDADGADPFGFTPRFSPGTLLQMESEYSEVTAVDTGTNTLTIRRGVNGSTAAAHVATTAINVWQVEEPIRRVCARQAGLLYSRRGAYQVEVLDGIGVVTYPQDLLVELQNTLTEFMYG